ncbi:MAG: flagellar hook-associated protein FlgK [Ketobacteraceae bacterium]|nr:flagellar hook-associated protein FlgK [Ketobacteraceae bacterium]
MPELANIALSGLSAHKTALATAGHNIANVNTDGYSRQVATFGTYPPQPVGNGFIGNGVNINNINRVTDQFVTTQLRRDTQNKEAFTAYHEFAVRLDSLVGDDATAITPTLINFFNAINDVADDPSSIPARQVLLSEGQALSNRFNSVYDQVEFQNNAVNQELGAIASSVTQLAAGIAELNEAIASTGSSAFNSAPNDLLDKRDEAIRKLSELVGITVITDNRGVANVSIGSGQPLVVGADSFSMISRRDDNGLGRNQLILQSGNGEINITEQVSGGRAGGLLDVRGELLDPVFNEIGRLAIAVSDTINQQHQLGMDLNNRLGQLFFSDINSALSQSARIAPDTNNNGNISVSMTIDDSSLLTTANYELAYDGTSGNYNVVNLTNNNTVASFAAPTTFPASIAVASEGFTLNFDVADPGNLPTTHVDGDSFLLLPTRRGASEIGLELISPNQVAAALPVNASTSTRNSGNGFVEEVQVTDTTTADFTTTPLQLTPPYRVIFTSTTSYEIHDLTDPSLVPSAGTLVGTGTYVPNQSNNLLTDASVIPAPLATGYEVVMNGEPQVNDSLDITYNAGAVNDNRNALLLADLQRVKTMSANTSSYQDAYNQMVGNVGTRTRDARVGEEAAEVILRQTEQRRESVSGVNLDEEAADLIRFQNAYQASARVIQVTSELFDTIIASLG